MKANEILKPSDNTLIEQIEANPTPGISKDDQLAILKAMRDDVWSPPQTPDELLAELRSLGYCK